MATVQLDFNNPLVVGGTTVGTIAGSVTIDYDALPAPTATGTITTTINPGNPGAGTYQYTDDSLTPININAFPGGNGYVITAGIFSLNGFQATAGSQGSTMLLWNSSTQTPTQISGSFITPGSTVDISNGNTISGTSYNGNSNPFPVTSSVVCFAAGTLIRTVRGDVPVETLRFGDVVITASGAERPIVWIGHKEFDCATHPDQKAVWPIRIMAGAFGDNRPSRDLFLSPQHSVLVNCVDEVLIPIRYLVNGGMIAQVPRDKISYWHVELDAHDILLAENLAAESFLDTQGRIGLFDNGIEHALVHPASPLKTMDDFCRPIMLDGPVIDAARARLIARMETLGWTATYDADLHVLADGVRIEGDVAGSNVRFILPAGTKELRIRSNSFVPEEFEVSSKDGRRLGVPLRSIRIDDGLDVARKVELDDPVLSQGFSYVQSDAQLVWRWTDGDAALPVEMWADCRGSFFLRLELAAERGHFRSWAAPAAAENAASEQPPVIDLDAHRKKAAS